MLAFPVTALATAKRPSLGADTSVLALKLDFTSILSRPSAPATRHLPLSPLFVALPYVLSASPLSSAFTHFNRGGRVRSLPNLPPRVSICKSRISSYLQIPLSATSLFSHLYKTPGVSGVPRAPQGQPWRETRVDNCLACWSSDSMVGMVRSAKSLRLVLVAVEAPRLNSVFWRSSSETTCCT